MDSPFQERRVATTETIASDVAPAATSSVRRAVFSPSAYDRG
jgi:hypothetical protein